MSHGKFREDPGKQTVPFAKDQADTIIKDPIEGVPVSEEWENPDLHVEAPIEDGHAARWQEHVYERPYEEATWEKGFCVELARFVVPTGMQGRVSVVETAVLFTPVDAPPFSNACFCPWFYEYVAGDFTKTALSFFLRLDGLPRLGTDPLPYTVPTPNSLPGKPHPTLGEWHDARYDYARRNVHVSLFVPEGHYLRLFVSIGAADASPFQRIWGRLAGITQTYRNNPNGITESRVWPGSG